MAGALFQNLSLGTAGHSIAGLVGQILGALMVGGDAAAGGGMGSIFPNVASGGIGGIKSIMNKPST